MSSELPPTPPEPTPGHEAIPIPQPLSDQEQAQRLSVAVAAQVARGARVESQTQDQAIVVFGKPVNHVLHLILTLVTCGAWALVWVILAIAGGEKRHVVRVDQYGNVLFQ